jgi:hypothetical protein
MKPNLTRWWEESWDSKAARNEMGRASHASKWKTFSAGHKEYDKAVRMCPRKMWDWSPRPGTHWSMREVIWHLADTEANIYIRLRKAAAESGSSVVSWDQMKWAKASNYRRLNPDMALALWGVLRTANVDLVKRLPAKAWKKKVRHPDHGFVTLEWNVAMAGWHLRHHLAQMCRRLREYKQR